MNDDKYDAIDLLKADHREAEKLFRQFESMKDSGEQEEKREIVRQVCAALLIHMQIEEAFFYPAAREALEDDALVDEAVVEHKGAKDLIRQLGESHIDSAMFDAKTKVLSEQIEHHVNEEEDELFPRLRRTNLDFQALGVRLAKEKTKLERTHNMAPA